MTGKGYDDYNELLDEIVILLRASLSLAGVADDKIESALDIYEAEFNKSDDNAPYTYKSVCEVILGLKKTHKYLFNSRES